MSDEITVVLAMHRGPATISAPPARYSPRGVADAMATWWHLSPPIDKFMDVLFLGTMFYSGPCMASVGQQGMLSLTGVVKRAVLRVKYGVSPSRLAREYQRIFGEAPDAIHVVGSHAWRNMKPTSDIDLLFETTRASLQRLKGATSKAYEDGFELFRRANPGKIPSRINHKNFEGFRGSAKVGPFEVPKAQMIDSYVGTLTPPKPAGVATKKWTP